jgi:hypothetical protein
MGKWDNTGLNSATHLGKARGSEISAINLTCSGVNKLEVNITSAASSGRKNNESPLKPEPSVELEII